MYKSCTMKTLEHWRKNVKILEDGKASHTIRMGRVSTMKMTIFPKQTIESMESPPKYHWYSSHKQKNKGKNPTKQAVTTLSFWPKTYWLMVSTDWTLLLGDGDDNNDHNDYDDDGDSVYDYYSYH